MPIEVIGSALAEVAVEKILKVTVGNVGKWFDDRILVKRITSPQDIDFQKALDIYDERIPEEVMLPRDVIFCLVRNSCETTTIEKVDKNPLSIWSNKLSSKNNFQEYFFVAKIKYDVCGLLWFQYYPERRLIFISYVVVSKKFKDRKGPIAAGLIQELGRLLKTELKECEAIIAEVEMAEASSPEKVQKNNKARVRLFKQLGQQINIQIKTPQIEYRQPHMILYDELPEKELSLLYGWTNSNREHQELTRDEYIRFLRFIYLDVYADTPLDDSNSEMEFQNYLSNFFEERIHDIPERILVR